MSDVRTRQLTITESLVRAYSRRGNYHSDSDAAAELGLSGLIAQGLQVAGPAYGELLDQLFLTAKRKAGFPEEQDPLLPPTFRRPQPEQIGLFSS